MNAKRVPTGVKGLDEMLTGGFLPGSAVLVRGAPGTGKTSLAMQYLVHGAIECNEPGLLITFEEFPRSLHRDASSLGWDLAKLERDGKLLMMFTSPQVLLASLQKPDSQLARLLMQHNVRRVALDSVSHFRRVSDDPRELRHMYNVLINAFKREDLTSILIGEERRSYQRRDERSGLSFVVDVIILLRYIEIESAIQRGLVVLKMRGSDHIKEIRGYNIGHGGIKITGVFEGREAILSGTPYRVDSDIAGT